MMLLRPSASRALLKGLVEERFSLGLTLPEQYEAIFVEFLSARLRIDGSNSYSDVSKVVHDLSDSHRSRLVDCRLVVSALLGGVENME
jgi:hypothetical protein